MLSPVIVFLSTRGNPIKTQDFIGTALSISTHLLLATTPYEIHSIIIMFHPEFDHYTPPH